MQYSWLSLRAQHHSIEKVQRAAADLRVADFGLVCTIEGQDV